MSEQDVDAMAREFLSAYDSGQTIPVPPSQRPGFDLDTAYRVETSLKKKRESQGRRCVGRKVGFANKAMWRLLKIDTLTWGHMYDDTVHYSDNNSAALSLIHARSLKIEPEIVFCLKRAISTKGLDAAAVLDATAWIALGFEIIDCPFPDWKFQASDFVASFGLHAALVVGEKMAVQTGAIASLVEDLARFKLRMLKNGEFVEEGSGRNSLRSPALCVAELAGAILRRFPDEPLAAGELISTGTLTGGHLLNPGDKWTAEVSGLALPPLTLTLN